VDNRKGKFIFGFAFLAVLVIVIAVLITASPPGGNPPGGNTTATPPITTLPIPGDDDVNGVPGVPITDEPTPTPTDSAPIIVVEKVEILYLGTVMPDFTEKIGTKIVLKLRITPEAAEDVPVWSSSNPDVFAVVPDATGRTATVTITGAGDEKLTVTVGDKTAKCDVRGRR
jgi:hypothetical protein